MKISGQEILSEKIRRLATQLFLKQLANGLHSPIHHSPSHTIHLVQKDKGMLESNLKDLGVALDYIITLPDPLILENNFCDIHLSNLSFQNKSHPDSLIIQLFQESIAREFPDFHIIATDASKSHAFTSIAGVSSSQSFAYRVHHINSVFTAEAMAICQALDDLNVVNKNLLILTNSLSVFQALNGLNLKSPKIIHRLKVNRTFAPSFKP